MNELQVMNEIVCICWVKWNKITFTTTVAIWIARLPMDHVKAYAFAAG